MKKTYGFLASFKSANNCNELRVHFQKIHSRYRSRAQLSPSFCYPFTFIIPFFSPSSSLSTNFYPTTYSTILLLKKLERLFSDPTNTSTIIRYVQLRLYSGIHCVLACFQIIFFNSVSYLSLFQSNKIDIFQI